MTKISYNIIHFPTLQMRKCKFHVQFLLRDDKGVTIGKIYSSTSAASKLELGELTSVSCLLFARRSFSIRRYFPVLDPTQIVSDVSESSITMSNICVFAAYVRSYIRTFIHSLCRWQFYGRVHIIRSRDGEFPPNVISRRNNSHSQFLMHYKATPLSKVFPVRGRHVGNRAKGYGLAAYIQSEIHCHSSDEATYKRD